MGMTTGRGKDVVLSIDVPRIHVFAWTESGEDTPRLGSALQVNPVTKEVDQ